LKARADQLEQTNRRIPLQVVGDFLGLLRDPNSHKEPLSLIADRFNYNGVLYTKAEVDEKSVLWQLRRRFSEPRPVKITVENLRAFDRHGYYWYFENSRFATNHRVISNDISRVAHFEIHTYLADADKTFVDGVFVGLDHNDKVVAWFD
jgi:hypothetical protein